MDQNLPTRDRIIVRTSLIGIVTNIFLAVFKAGVGVFSHSIAVILDAVNNLSDALSSDRFRHRTVCRYHFYGGVGKKDHTPGKS